MAPKVRISQDAFDSAVRENVEDFGMDEQEALADAMHTFQLQGVDLTGIITDGKGSSGNPVVQAVQELEAAVSNDAAESEIEEALTRLRLACDEEQAPQNHSIAVQNGAVQAAVSACKLLFDNPARLGSALATLCSLLKDEQSQRDFDSCDGPRIVVAALDVEDSNGTIPMLAGQVLASAALRNEVLKEKFMQLKAEDVLVGLICKYRQDSTALTGIFSALRSLVTADDARVLASNTFRNARRIAKAGAMEAILEGSSGAGAWQLALLPTLCATLKAIAVNDEICRSVAALGGLSLVLQLLDESVKVGDTSLARNSCSLLSQLAGSDANRDEIVSQGACQKLVRLASCYSDEVSVLQEVMSALACLCLRSPANASKAVEAGAIDLAADIMQRHSSAASMQKQACQMLRNLAVRNPENRPLILERGLDDLIRGAKSKHSSCRDAASAALRDLGLENYN